MTEAGIELNSLSAMDQDASRSHESRSLYINKRIVLKLDLILLPFLSLLFLLNALDKSNVGNAEAAHFTQDLGLPKSALNVSVACFFAVFVALQPAGAFFGRKFGMVRWVPACMFLWGICTALHVAVRHEWQLIVLRILIGSLEAGFYPTTVSYLSLWYTRFEFGKRLAFFYGQASLAGALGGLLSWAVFSYFPNSGELRTTTSWKSWEVLFMIEGCLTMIVAFVGFFWLPHSANTAWFLTTEERAFAEHRMIHDQSASSRTGTKYRSDIDTEEHRSFEHEPDSRPLLDTLDEQEDQEDQPLPSYDQPEPFHRRASHTSALSITADSGLTRADIFSATFDWKVWFLLFCNILSAIPATAFSVFLPLVIEGLATGDDNGTSPAVANLLVIPPFLAGAAVLWLFAMYSDRSQKRLVPVLYGLTILLAGLIATVMLPTHAYTLRYVALVVLLSGSYIASPLTISWFANNIPEPGKRAIILGINGWGNLAGVFSALLFAPRYAEEGYLTPFFVTLACVLVAFLGYMMIIYLIKIENRRRSRILGNWNHDEVAKEATFGDMAVPEQRNISTLIKKVCRFDSLRGWANVDRARRGDEKMTFTYGL